MQWHYGSSSSDCYFFILWKYDSTLEFLFTYNSTLMCFKVENKTNAVETLYRSVFENWCVFVTPAQLEDSMDFFLLKIS